MQSDQTPLIGPAYQGSCPAVYTPAAPEQVTVRWTGIERRILRRRKDMPTSKWAAKYRRLTSKESDYEGPWKNELTPYAVGIMDAFFAPSVRRMTVCAPPQTGKSEAVNNIIGKAIDMAPGPILPIYPNETDAKRNLKHRLLPMVKNSPQLAGYLTGLKEDESQALINLSHMVLRAAWAGSAQSLGSWPARYVIFEETDKYEDKSTSRETGAINLGFKRLRSYRGRGKVLLVSTPTTEAGPIWQYLCESEIIFEYAVRCPKCGEIQVMEMGSKESDGGLKIPEGERDPNTVESGGLASYQCRSCRCRWDDYLRDQAVGHGYWRQRTDDGSGLALQACLERRRPRRIGFQYNALISPFVSLSEYAAAFLKGLRSKDSLRDFSNAYEAQPWLEYETVREEDAIVALRTARPAGEVPGEQQVACLLAGIDTQDYGFWYEIRAYGHGFLQESWQIRSGFLPADWAKVSREELADRPWPYHPAFDGLRRVLWEDEYLDEEGNAHPVRLAGIDAMGHHTAEVYDFCRAHRGRIVPLQGMKNRSNTPHKWSKMDKYPGTNKPIPGSIQLLQLDVNHYKDELSSRLQIAPLDPGAWHMNADTTVEWCRHLCAEYPDDKGRWQCPKNKENHGWDCSVYSLALADVLGLKHWRRQNRRDDQDRSARQKKQKQVVNPYTRGHNPFQR